MSEILKYYESRKAEIKKRLEEFGKMRDSNDKKIFAELCFCICTPRSNAKKCDEAVRKLESSGLLFSGNPNQIKPFMRQISFYERKSEYIVEARKFFEKGGKIKIRNFIESFLETKTENELRLWLADNVNGIGMKESSHFLRNIGIGNFAILDTHILKNMKVFGVINEIPNSMTRKKYIEIENKMGEFSEKIGIPMSELDLVFWSKETGFVFK